MKENKTLEDIAVILYEFLDHTISKKKIEEVLKALLDTSEVVSLYKIFLKEVKG